MNNARNIQCQIEALRAMQMEVCTMVEEAYREGFIDGTQQNNCSNPAIVQAWNKSETCTELDKWKKSGK